MIITTAASYKSVLLGEATEGGRRTQETSPIQDAQRIKQCENGSNTEVIAVDWTAVDGIAVDGRRAQEPHTSSFAKKSEIRKSSIP